jgi:hypothetical protein
VLVSGKCTPLRVTYGMLPHDDYCNLPTLPSLVVKPAPASGVEPRLALGEAPWPGLGVGLYELACRAAHSCQPNTFWFSDLKGRRVMRTLVAVEAGEEVSSCRPILILLFDFSLFRCALPCS